MTTTTRQDAAVLTAFVAVVLASVVALVLAVADVTPCFEDGSGVCVTVRVR
jgi:hypothetical protein